MIKKNGAHSDQCAILHGTGVHHRAMADCYAIPNCKRPGIVGHMQRDIILNVRSFTDPNRAYIAPDNRIKPHTGFRPDLHITYDTRPIGKKYCFMNLRMDSTI
jgi:hypothetical protein